MLRPYAARDALILISGTEYRAERTTSMPPATHGE